MPLFTEIADKKASLELYILLVPLPRSIPYTRTPDPTSSAAAGRSTEPTTAGPPLEGRGAVVSPVADALMTPAATRSPDSPDGSVW